MSIESDILYRTQNYVYDLAVEQSRTAQATMQEAHVIQSQINDCNLSHAEWLVWLDGLTAWEQAHDGKSPF